MAKRRRSNRMCAPNDRVEVFGESARRLRETGRVRTGYVEDCVKSTVWVRLDDGSLWGAHADDVRPSTTAQLNVMRSHVFPRLHNPDPARIAAAARSYQDALGAYADRIRSGADDREIDGARRDLDAANKKLQRSLGPSRPVTVMAAAGGAAIGAAAGGPVGAAAGAVLGGVVPLAVRTVTDRRARREPPPSSSRYTNPKAARVATLKRGLLK